MLSQCVTVTYRAHRNALDSRAVKLEMDLAQVEEFEDLNTAAMVVTYPILT